jgi:hypothetical protein
MQLLEIEKQTATLSREEKLELIKYLTEDLLKDERLQYVEPSSKHGFWSQINAFDAAQKMQDLVDSHSS